MKVFISWSGEQSKKLGETLRDWLPAVIQLVTPYFTPEDVEKGTRWQTEISKELSESQIGILCVTRQNIHSDWILFEAGALSKTLEKPYVCPFLFGISNTDLAGPLKQFQTTEFEKTDVRRLLGVINGQIGDAKLKPKTLDTVFEKWWPELEEKISQILIEVDEPEEPIRSDRELLEEILQLNRTVFLASKRSRISPTAIRDLLAHFIELHNSQAEQTGDYEDTLAYLEKMSKPVAYISRRYEGTNEELDELLRVLGELSYATNQEEKDEELPF